VFPENLKYSKEHQWVSAEGGSVKIGITDYAQQQLGDIVLVELPGAGAKLEKGKNFGVVESVKSVSDLPSPVSGEVTDVNKEIANHPELINKDPYGKGWMITVKIDKPDDINELLSASEYEKTIKQAEG
jgi:glycine cleavage system H protein